MNWNSLDWRALDRLRGTFLNITPGGASYWTSLSDLENYNATFAQRIGWKWDAALRGLTARGWTPPCRNVVDWGCGSGIAARRVIETFGAEHFDTLRVYDRSPLAMEFATRAAQEAFPKLRVEPLPAATGPGDERIGLLVISHVLNELDEAGGRALRAMIDRADAVLWVEPGTHVDSRSLIAVRESLREQFTVVAPCTHQEACGLLTPGNERHWCHFFGTPAFNIMADSDWVRFANHMGIDLRSLPYSYLVLERRGLRDSIPGALPEGCSRIIGFARIYKPFAKIFNCQAAGVSEVELTKRHHPAEFKLFKNHEAGSLWRWELEGARVTKAERIGDVI